MPRFVAAAISGAVLLLCGAHAPASAQAPLFSDHSELPILIEGPIGAIVRTAARSTDPHPAVATITPEASAAERFEIQLSPRGVSRRTGGICNFPPLRLDFDRTSGTYMRGQNRLKLVTRCRTGAQYEQVTVLEYLAYRLYNEITPMSLRVRPARVTYRDNEGRRREETQFNFLVEDIDDVARRNGRLTAIEVRTAEVRSADLAPAAAADYALFQYMIGNLDWDMTEGRANEECCHNSKLLAANAEARSNVIPVPYDFDHSGLVDAPYATPPAGIDVASVRTRVYRGYCRHNAQLPAAVERFRARRAALLAIVDNEPRLSQANRRSARRYIEDFFAVLDDPQRFDRQIVQRCRG